MKNIKVAIHQPHYFPWLGYFDKMAKVDIFIVLDEVQLTDKSNMFRNIFLSKSGAAKYLTIPFEKKRYMEKACRELTMNQNVAWQENHRNFIKDNYRKAPYFKEVWDKISYIFEKKYDLYYDTVMDSLNVVKEMLNIHTIIMNQSEFRKGSDSKKNDLVLMLCLSASANTYLSGIGARKYMNDELYERNGIKVVYQNFTYPDYKQIYSEEFVPNLSSLDILFNCGIERTKEIFWNNVKSKNEFGTEG